MNITGNANNSINENHHPLIKAKNSPDTLIASANNSVPIFSPNAFYIL
jgi:hypothetical protein